MLWFARSGSGVEVRFFIVAKPESMENFRKKSAMKCNFCSEKYLFQHENTDFLHLNELCVNTTFAKNELNAKALIV